MESWHCGWFGLHPDTRVGQKNEMRKWKWQLIVTLVLALSLFFCKVPLKGRYAASSHQTRRRQCRPPWARIGCKTPGGPKTFCNAKTVESKEAVHCCSPSVCVFFLAFMRVSLAASKIKNMESLRWRNLSEFSKVHVCGEESSKAGHWLRRLKHHNLTKASK